MRGVANQSKTTLRGCGGRACLALALQVIVVVHFGAAAAQAADVFARFRVLDPPEGAFKVVVGGCIHVKDWHLPAKTVEVAGGEWSRWLDLRSWPLHKRMNRAGGVAEWPSMKLTLVRAGKRPEPIGPSAVEVQLADRPDEEAVVIAFTERSQSNIVAFLLPHPLRENKGEFETGSAMAARHLAWAKEATGGQGRRLKKFEFITALWGHYDPGLAAQETETLKLLGFNVLRGAPPSVLQAAGMKTYVPVGHLDPDPDRATETWNKDGAARIAKALATDDGRWTYEHAAHCVIADEIKTMNFARVDVAKLNPWFRQYLRDRGETDRSLGKPIDEIEFPINEMFGAKQAAYARTPPRDAELATRAVFYHAGKFAQRWSVAQLRHTGDLVKQSLAELPSPIKTETLPSDHAYFAIGMGYRTLDLFEIGARQAVDILSAEDWLGLNHMYGPGYTWTGAMAFGYFNGILRSGVADGNVALRALITPSDDGYLRLKAYTALGQGAKSIFFWTYGPTYIGTENYWSDLRSEYDGIARLAAALEKAEDILYPARPVRDRVAMLYSVSHDLWHTDDPAGAVENRLTWAALRHLSVQPDILREEDVEQGRLADYDVLYVAGQCLTRKAAQEVDAWIKRGGVALLTAGAATRDEYYEPALPAFAAAVWPADAAARLVKETGHRYNERVDLPTIEPLARAVLSGREQSAPLPVIGMRQDLNDGIASENIWATFDDGKPAAATVGYGKGTVMGVGFLPGLAYSPFKAGQKTLDEVWPDGPRAVIARPLQRVAETRTLEVSTPVVEASLLDGEQGAAIVLVNHTYQPVPKLRIHLGRAPEFGEALSTEGAKIAVTRSAGGVDLELPLDWTDIVLLPKPAKPAAAKTGAAKPAASIRVMLTAAKTAVAKPAAPAATEPATPAAAKPAAVKPVAAKPAKPAAAKPKKPAAAKTAAAPPVSLAPVFGPGADQAWTVAGGGYSIQREASFPLPIARGADDAQPGPPALVVDDAGRSVTLEGLTRHTGAIEIQATFRLGERGPVEFTVARRPLDANSPPDNVAAANPAPANRPPAKDAAAKDAAEKTPENPAPARHASAKTAAERNLRFQIMRRGSDGPISAAVTRDGHPLHDIDAESEKLAWKSRGANSLSYLPRAYVDMLPGWSDDFLAHVEHDMGEMPAPENRWLRARIELRRGLARFWLDDRLVAWRQDDTLDPDGAMKIMLGPGVRLAEFSVKPLLDPGRFQPISLGGYVNGRALLGTRVVDEASLPSAGALTMIGGVPFVFPGLNYGRDHLDISRSHLRQGDAVGQSPAQLYRFAGAAKRDPARIQLRVPNAAYDALYLIAAADERPDAAPLVTAMFYRPGAGFAECFECRVPLATASSGSGDAQPLAARLADGTAVNLWLVRIPLDPGRLSSFADLDVVEIELTKQVRLFRSYPDPIQYGLHQAGLPSSAHVYAATLAESPIGFLFAPDRFGHVWQAPARPKYTATIENRSPAAVEGRLTVVTRSYDGSDQTRQERPISLPAAGKGREVARLEIPVAFDVKLYGYHDVEATLELAGRRWTEKRSLTLLAPDTRRAQWTGQGPLFGYWSYHGGHYTPQAEETATLMIMAGARTARTGKDSLSDSLSEHLSPPAGNAWPMNSAQPKAWADSDDFDPLERRKFQEDMLAHWQKDEAASPPGRSPRYLFFGAEPHLSARLTDGNIPEYWSEKPISLTPEETRAVARYMRLARAGTEMARERMPGKKLLIPWGDPGFVWPLLRAGFPHELIDGTGLDLPLFEHLPEKQLHEQSVHRLYETKQEFAKAGIANPDLPYIEGIFVPTEPGAVSWREQMDIYNRWTLISMAYGVQRFYSGWFAFDCGDYYGAEHYGGCGIQRRIPYCDPKPAYAAYATLTDKLGEAEFDGWLPTGSLSSYALRFKRPGERRVYALWTLRGKRPMTLELGADAVVEVTDTMNNTRRVDSRNRQVTVATDPSVIYVTLPPGADVAAVRVGTPDHGDARPAADARPLAELGDGSWRFTGERDAILENNHFAVMRYPGQFALAVSDDSQQGRALATRLIKPETPHELMPWYGVLRPGRPIEIAGAPARLGLWVKGGSDWGRVVYVLRDAKGERWTSIGAKDQYTCDDPHCWSQFCFDGWRYLTFELPGHAPWDSFRKHGTTWWRSGDGGDEAGRNIVDLPLSLEAIIVEQRTHILYVNDPQPVAGDSVAFGRLYAEYETPRDATAEAVRQSALRMPAPAGSLDLPNPIARLEREGVGEPAAIEKLVPPLHLYDGTRMHVHFREAAAATKYFLWVGRQADGRGAVNLTPRGLRPGQLVGGLRPGVPLYYWIVYLDGDGKLSKPSRAHVEVTVDNFKEK